MDHRLIEQLVSSFENLTDLNQRFRESLLADEALPTWLPAPYSQTHRVLATQALTQLWHDDTGDYPISGIVCASPETLAVARALNEAKRIFKDTISDIKQASGQKKTRASKLIERILTNEQGRPEHLVLALKKARIGHLNLLSCYRKVQILPVGLKSISWTWSRQHREINRITRQEAIQLLDSLENDDTRVTVSRLLDQHPDNEPLAYVKGISRQLRANLVWVEGDAIKRKPIVTSSIVLSQDTDLPRRLKWANEEAQPRLPRSDIEISAEPYIRALNLYKYIS